MKIILCFLFIFSLSTFAKSSKKDIENVIVKKEKLEKQRWNHILNLINEEIKTINMVRRKSQKLTYRLFELKSEKIKLFKSKENKEFIAKKMKFGKKVKRKNAFRKTLALYNDAHTYGMAMLKKHPRTSYKAAIYYTLALNARDFAYDTKELGYLNKAIRFSKNQKQVRYLATTSLAEYYYNQKNYKRAVSNYEKIIGNREDEWLTKNLYNYGWCLLKTHKFDDAINRLEDGHRLSSDEFYIDMRDQIMGSLVSFYVYGKQIKRGIKFIDKHATNKNASLLKLAQKASGKGFFKETEGIISDLLKRVHPIKDIELYTEMRLFQFDLYKQYHKSKKLLKIARLLPKLKLNEYQREDSIRKVSEVVGASQIILKKDYSKHDKTYDKGTLKTVITYFNILAKIDNKEKAQYEYFKAETYYSVGRFKSALRTYRASLRTYDKIPSKNDLRSKNMDAVFSCIDFIKFNKGQKKIQIEFAYNKYLSYWPKNKKAQDIFPRLYTLYATDKRHGKMQKTLDRYISNFKNDSKIQKDLYRSHLDLLIKDKNTQLLAAKINKMKTGYLKFPPLEIKKSETILATILFARFQELNHAGDQKGALAGYKQVHFTKYYPSSIKAEAAFNMGMIYTDIQDNNNAIKWYQKSFEFYNKKEKANKRVFLEKMALRTELLHNFLYSAKLNKFILQNFCNEKKANQRIFAKAVQNDLANDYISKAMYTIEKKGHCINKFSASLKKEVMVHLFENKHESALRSFVKKYKILNIYRDEVSYYYERLFWKYYIKDPKKQKLYFYELNQIKYDSKTKLLTNALNQYNSLVKKIKWFKPNIIKTKNIKDPNIFSGHLQTRLGKLKPLIDHADAIFKLGHGQVSVLVYDQLTILTESIRNEILGYKLPIKDKDFQKQFKNSMIGLAGNINSEKLKYQRNAQELIEKYELLIVAREESHPSFEIIKVSDIRSPASVLGITYGLGR